MKQRTWVILGATSIIAEEFAHCAAAAGNSVRLVGRQKEQLNIIAHDIELRYQVPCDVVVMDMVDKIDACSCVLKKDDSELDLFIAHSDFTDNAHLNAHTINQLIAVNILATTLLIHAYLSSQQKEHHLLYISSVAACRGRAKNSLYGASKAAIETYLQGLQQANIKKQTITIARLGFIDTKQCYGLPGIFHAALPSACAKACWQGINARKRMIYFPRFWRIIMAIIRRLPFFLYKKMAGA